MQLKKIGVFLKEKLSIKSKLSNSELQEQIKYSEKTFIEKYAETFITLYFAKYIWMVDYL